ncbi:hypothetical protein QBC39DRAFT_337841 [Podospora conica]|nr:hypothetical protein QBC39DRAFT_337841 [Schizothecium conicum]
MSTPGAVGHPHPTTTNPSNPPGPAHPHPRPVIKMKRTGNVGSFPAPLGPSTTSTASTTPNPSIDASRGTSSTSHRPQGIPQQPSHPAPSVPSTPSVTSVPHVPSIPRPTYSSHQGAQLKLPRASLSDNEQQVRQPASPALDGTSKTPVPGISLLRPFFQKAGEQKTGEQKTGEQTASDKKLGEQKTTAPPPETAARPGSAARLTLVIPDSDATDEDDSQPAQPYSLLPAPETHDRQGSMESTTATRPVDDLVMKAPDDPDADSDSSSFPMMEASARKHLSSSSIPGPSRPENEAPSRNEKRAAFTLASALDDAAYKTFLTPDGTALPTHGVLIPHGYKVSQDARCPWICPIRSCRRKYPGILNLRSHFMNSHRAACFNDNLDGTLTDLGTYDDPIPGNGRRNGGVAKRPILVSKGPMSLSAHPLEPERIGGTKQTSSSLPTPLEPRKRRATNPTPSLDGFESDPTTSEEDEPSANLPKGTIIQMANPDRKYNRWTDESGKLVRLPGSLLLPDDYVKNHRVRGRPWICPIRSCRRLYNTMGMLAYHWKVEHTGRHLNDNLDGTFTEVGPRKKISKDSPASVVVSRGRDDSEPIVAPKVPKYKPNRNVYWVDAPDSDAVLSDEEYPVRHDVTKQASHHLPDPSPEPESDSESESAAPKAIDSDVEILFTKSGRRYSEWTNAETGDTMVERAVAIPDGYEMCNEHPSRPWVCPVRSCRMLCKSFKGMGNHFTRAHRGQKFNDNGDGTFSIVPAPLGKRHAVVVSQNPLDPSEPPMAALKIPMGGSPSGTLRALPTSYYTKRPAELPDRATTSGPSVAVVNDKIKISSKPTSSTSKNRYTGNKGTGHTTDNWAHICAHLGKYYPMPTDECCKALLGLPRLRPLRLSPAMTTTPSDRQLIAVLIYMTGIKWDAPCTNCRRSPPPFHACVRLLPRMINDRHLVDNLRSLRRCCANCIFGSAPHTCSVRNPGTWETYVQQVTGASVTPTAGPVESRSHQRRLGEIEASDADEEEETRTWNLRKRRRHDRTPSEEPPPKRNVVTMRVHPDKLGGATASAPTASRPGRQTAGVVAPEARQDILEMEDWELEDGHIAASNARSSNGHLATHVSIGQTIRLSKDVTVSTQAISAGAAFNFPTHSKQTRVCTMISGKLKVTVDAEKEFVIGSRSMFRFGPGAKCFVANGYYVDAVVHVTTFVA